MLILLIRESRPMSTEDIPSLESVARPAVAIAALVTVVHVVVTLLDYLMSPGTRDPLGRVGNQLVGVVADAALIGAVLLLVVAGTSMTVVKWGAVAVYAGALIENLLFVATTNSIFFANTVLSPLYVVALFVGFVAAVRTFEGEPILPGVDVRIDVTELAIERPGREAADGSTADAEAEADPLERPEPR